MTHTTLISTAPAILFRVTLNWSPTDRQLGDYCTNVWAADADAAIRSVAEEMADHPDAELDEDNEQAREEYIELLIEHAGPYAAAEVAPDVLSGVHGLLAGPAYEMTPQASKDYAAIEALLKKYVPVS